MNQPNFFIIGAPKCGTTSLSDWLTEHPNVFMSPVKEPHYFNTDLRRTIIDNRNEYEDLFRNAGPQHRAIGEASVLYLYSRVAVPQILGQIPEARFVVMLRNPITMAPSLHEQVYFSFDEDEQDFESAWRKQDYRARGKQLPSGCTEPKLLQYGQACSLGEQVNRLLQYASRERCHFILLDDLKKNTRESWLRLLAFLGVADDGRTTFPTKNTAKARRYPQLARAVLKIGRLKTKLFGRSFSIGLLNRANRATRVERSRKPIAPTLQQELENYFHDDVRLLEKLIDRNLSHWIPRLGHSIYVSKE